jgi:hypothetical protein
MNEIPTKPPKPESCSISTLLRIIGFIVCCALAVVAFVLLDNVRDKPADSPLPISTNAVPVTNAPPRTPGATR